MFPNCMPDIMILHVAQAVLRVFCWQCCFTIQNAEVGKGRKLSQIFTVNQVIYILDIICMPHIMTLAQVVLQIFCSQGHLWVKCPSPKRGIIQSNFDRILWKVNRVIYVMYSNCMLDIMILAQVVLQLFVHKVALLHKMPKSEKEDNSVKYLQNFAKS